MDLFKTFGDALNPQNNMETNNIDKVSVISDANNFYVTVDGAIVETYNRFSEDSAYTLATQKANEIRHARQTTNKE